MTATSRNTLSFPKPFLQVPLTPLRIEPLKRLPMRPADQKLVERVRREFSDMRGLSPTIAQARRLFHLGIADGREIFGQLVGENFLELCSDDRYRLRSPNPGGPRS